MSDAGKRRRSSKHLADYIDSSMFLYVCNTYHERNGDRHPRLPIEHEGGVICGCGRGLEQVPQQRTPRVRSDIRHHRGKHSHGVLRAPASLTGGLFCLACARSMNLSSFLKASAAKQQKSGSNL